jgi:hypothetical protein
MIFFSIGLPSQFAEWCDRLILRLVERCFGSAEAVALNGLDELAARVIRSKTSNLVVCCRQPVLRLQAEILQAQCPFLLALGDPRAALAHLVEHAGYNFADAARAVASSCAAMLTVSQGAQALAVTPQEMQQPSALLHAIARHFQFGLAENELAELGQEVSSTAADLIEQEVRPWWETLSERERSIADGACQPYIAHFAGNQLDRLVWEPELFYTSEDPPSATLLPLTEPIDVTGRQRFLVYGPFINLPSGSWSADVVLGFSAETTGVGFSIEVFAGSQLAHTRIEATGEQVIQSRLYFTLDNAVDQAVQIRISNERAAFDGRLALGYVAMTPQPTISGETRERLAQVLHVIP